MKIHFLSNSLNQNSGFSIVTKEIALGLKKLGHEISMTGLQTAYLLEYHYGIECFPIQTDRSDETGQFMQNIMAVDPDVVIYVGQMDADLNHMTKVFKKTVCLLPDSPILTLDRGVQKIKDIKIGDKVLTHKGRFMRTSHVMKREYNGDMIKIVSHKLKSPICLTPEHKILAVKTSSCTGDSGVDRCRPGAKCYRNINGHQYKRCKYIHGEEPWRKYKTLWIDAKDLCVGDWVVYPKANEKEIDIEKIRILDYIEDSLDITGDDYGDFTSQTDLFGSFIDKTIIMRNSYNAHEIPAEILLDKDFMRLCGYFIAEGGITFRKEGDVEISAGIQFAFNANEEYYINDVKNLMKSIFGLDVTHERKDLNSDGYNITYSNRILSVLFENLFAPNEYQIKKGRGRKSNIVRIPPGFLNLPLEKLREMVKGIWRGDGSYYKSSENCKKNSYEYSIHTTSETLAHQLTYIMSRFNILCSIDLKYPRKDNHVLAYDISIMGQDIYIFEKIINERNLNRESYKQVNKYIRGDKFFYLPIRDIDIIKYNGDVYNLEVEEDNSYISMIAVHNCYSPVEGRDIPIRMANDLRFVIQNGGKIVSQCFYGQSEMKKVGVESTCIYHGYDPNLYYKLDEKDWDNLGKDIKCYFATDVGRESSNPRMLCERGCYNCVDNRRENNRRKDGCPDFKEEEMSILKWIDGKWTQFAIPISKLRDILKDRDKKFLYLHVGQNFGIRKRQERLLKAYSIMIKDNKQLKDRTHIHMHCLPISIRGMNLIDVIGKLEIEENVTFSYGSTRSNAYSDEAMNVVYNLADVNVSASSSEGFGIPTLISMALGVPNIGPDCSSFVELIGNDKDESKNRGWLANIGEWQMVQDSSYRALVDEKDLSIKMKMAYSNKDIMAIYSDNTIQFAKQYTWENVVDQWDNLLGSI